MVPFPTISKPSGIEIPADPAVAVAAAALPASTVITRGEVAVVAPAVFIRSLVRTHLQQLLQTGQKS